MQSQETIQLVKKENSKEVTTSTEVKKTPLTSEKHNTKNNITILENIMLINAPYFLWRILDSSKPQCLAKMEVVSKVTANKVQSIHNNTSIDVFSKTTEKLILYFYEDNIKVEVIANGISYSYLYQPLRKKLVVFSKAKNQTEFVDLGIIPFLESWVSNLTIAKGMYKDKISNYLNFYLPRLEETFQAWRELKMKRKDQ